MFRHKTAVGVQGCVDSTLLCFLAPHGPLSTWCSSKHRGHVVTLLCLELGEAQGIGEPQMDEAAVWSPSCSPEG